MRQTASRTNRFWLTLIGITLILGGIAGLAVSLDLIPRLTSSLGYTLTVPPPAAPILPGLAAGLARTEIVVAIVLIGVVLGLLALAWLIAQIPRTNQAKPFRLHDDVTTGLTRCSPTVLTTAIESRINALSGVRSSSAVLRGTAQRPELTVRVTASDRADLPELLHTLHHQIAGEVGAVLDTHLHLLAVQLDIHTGKATADHIVL